MNSISTCSTFGIHRDQPLSQALFPAVPDPSSLRLRSIRSLFLEGPAGRLEAVLNEGAAGAPFAALVCHPHPLFGGSLHNKVVYHAMKTLNDSAWGLSLPVLRFNFRGVGLSEGHHDGNAECEDVLAALDWLHREFNRPVLLAGFSFGAAMAIRAGCRCAESNPSSSVPSIPALIAIGLPTVFEYSGSHSSCLQRLSIPKLFVSGDRDRFSSVPELEQLAAQAAEPSQLVIIPGADHFFTHQLQTMQRAIAGWSQEIMP